MEGKEEKVKKFKNLVLVFVVAALILVAPGCGKSPVVPVDDIFSVAPVTHREIPAYMVCDVYFTWSVQYTNNSDFQKSYDFNIEFGDGKILNGKGVLSPTTTIKIDTGDLSHAYHLKEGETKVVNAKFTFISPDPEIQPIVQVVPITIRTA